MTARMTKTLRPRRTKRRVDTFQDESADSFYRNYHSYPHDLEVMGGEPNPELYLYKGAGGPTRAMETRIITGDRARKLLARLHEATIVWEGPDAGARIPPSLGGGDGVAQVLAEAWSRARGGKYDYWDPKAGRGGRGARVRAVSAIAADILSDWPNVNYAAKPYLEAMFSLRGVDDAYLYDSGRGIITRFLGNARSWRGPKARTIKAELKAMLDA